jgi:predicted nucleotidyltransferase
MLKELLKNKNFLKVINESLKNIEIVDIILFGSVVREKDKPNDIDILVLYLNESKKIENEIYGLRKNLEKIDKRFELIGKSYKEIFNSGFLARESLLSEGFSMRNKKPLAESFGYKSLVMFRYNLSGLSKSKRMQFYYSLNGRGKERGILNKTDSYKFSDNIIFSNISNSEFINDFFKNWEIKYSVFPLLIPINLLEKLK